MVMTSVTDGSRNGKHISKGCTREWIIMSKLALDPSWMIMTGGSAYKDLPVISCKTKVGRASRGRFELAMMGPTKTKPITLMLDFQTNFQARAMVAPLKASSGCSPPQSPTRRSDTAGLNTTQKLVKGNLQKKNGQTWDSGLALLLKIVHCCDWI